MPDWSNLLPTGSITWVSALLSVLVLVATFVIAHFAKRGVNALSRQWPGLHPELISLTARIVKYAIILLGIGIVLALLGANIQPVLAAVIIVAAVGFLAVRGIATNFGAAVIIQSRRSIHVDQWIEVLGYVGRVRDLNSRAVVIVTRDGLTVHLPNASVLENPMINHSEGGATRSALEIRVGGRHEQGGLHGTILQAAAATPGVLGAPAPDLLVRTLSPEGATFELRVWHAPLHDPSVSSAVVVAVHEALSTSGARVTVTSTTPVPPLTPPASV